MVGTWHLSRLNENRTRVSRFEFSRVLCFQQGHTEVTGRTGESFCQPCMSEGSREGGCRGQLRNRLGFKSTDRKMVIKRKAEDGSFRTVFWWRRGKGRNEKGAELYLPWQIS